MEIYAVEVLSITQENLDNLCLLISEEKRCKIKKFVNKEDKIRSLIGEILIRSIVVNELNIANEYITFHKNKYGKPCFKGYPTIKFNISHSGNFVICAIDDKPIGIDIEEIKHIEYESIAKNFFTKSELDYIIKQNPDSKLSKFYEIWTLKESYIKCCGQGLTRSLKSFSIDIDKCHNIKVIPDEYNEYEFKTFDTIPGYKVAVCSVSKQISNNVIMINQNSLINNYSKFNQK
ncbi:4'-phosphopantetheinyl transferase family protein [Clostridium estertheticum]|uniref:4'-phosphopantetheinyl transferase family protein n=1 Tax=Clostridium estertheticum TaxID=238834 RepID=UPI001C0DF0C7|nr:4'-phosphopantetheinyl transferase superfamily protein [Clostridium estertheticum]MBU3184566.1 4'-phosphopantetheinyl transferase superfamily protein [Clostridium estertheticum]